LGLRRFFRVVLATGPVSSLVARVERPDDSAGRPSSVPAEPPLEPIRALLARHGLPVPARYGGDTDSGIELLEDVGDESLDRAVAGASTEQRRTLYESACDLVPRLQSISDPGGVAAFERRLDDALFAYKADLFNTWILEDRRSASRDTVAAVFALAARDCARAPYRLAHRDFQSANLHRIPGRGLVMIDFQGAFLAPPEYDLVCLLRDSYVDLSEEAVAHQVARIRPRLPDSPSRDDFERRFDLLTLTRKGKDLARFLYAAATRGDRRYLAYVPRTLRLLQEASTRCAARDARLHAFEDLCHELRDLPCAP
jgi:hypothetical protein